MLVEQWIMIHFMPRIQGIAFDFCDIFLKGIIPRLIQQVRALTQPEQDEGDDDTSNRSQSSERNYCTNSSGCDGARTRSGKGDTSASKARSTISTANPTLIILGGRTIDGGRQAITAQASRAVSATNTTDINGHGTHVTTVVHTVGTRGAITAFDKTDVKPATSARISITSQTRLAIAAADSTDVNLAARARRRCGWGLGDVDWNTITLDLDQPRRASVRETLFTPTTGGVKSVTALALGHGTRHA